MVQTSLTTPLPNVYFFISYKGLIGHGMDFKMNLYFSFTKVVWHLENVYTLYVYTIYQSNLVKTWKFLLGGRDLVGPPPGHHHWLSPLFYWMLPLITLQANTILLKIDNLNIAHTTIWGKTTGMGGSRYIVIIIAHVWCISI